MQVNRPERSPEPPQPQRQTEGTEPSRPRISRRRAIQVVVGVSGGIGVVLVGRAIRNRGLPSETIEGNRVEFNVATADGRGELVKPIERKQAEFRREELDRKIGLDLIRVPAGEFEMGAPSSEAGRSGWGIYEGPQHRVSVPGFWMGKYAVTQAQWKAVVALPKVARDLDADPARFEGDNRPVEQVSWEEAVEFCDRLSRQVGREYRLPSEAEWEYACRAGTTTPFHFGETITPEIANYDGNYTYGSGPKGVYREETTAVGSLKVANAFGLYDMHGNVWEWCSDRWHDNYQGAPTDGSAWVAGGAPDRRLLRGGSWNLDPGNCRSANRLGDRPGARYNSVGFRVVCTLTRSASKFFAAPDKR